jgi:hypothetical protein
MLISNIMLKVMFSQYHFSQHHYAGRCNADCFGVNKAFITINVAAFFVRSMKGDW